MMDGMKWNDAFQSATEGKAVSVPVPVGVLSRLLDACILPDEMRDQFGNMLVEGARIAASDPGQNNRSIVDEIRNLIRGEITDPEHDASAASVSAAICDLVSEILLLDDSEHDKFDDWVMEIRSQRCKMLGQHDWIPDQCGYWGHQFCSCCLSPKYVGLAGLSCSDAKSKIGDITEDEYAVSKFEGVFPRGTTQDISSEASE